MILSCSIQLHVAASVGGLLTCLYRFLSSKALRQFHDMYETRSNMEEVYVMGHRLVAFLKHALRRHSMFDAVENYDLRAKRRQDLDWIQNRLDVVALRIDEEEWNQHILRDLDSHLSKGADSEATNVRRGREETQWENFSGWTTVGEGEFAWEEAHDVSFETSATEEEDFYEDDENPDVDDEDSDDMYSGVIDYVEVGAAYDEESEHVTDTMHMVEADDYSLWHITAVEESIDDSQAVPSVDLLQEPSNDVVTVNLRRSPVKVLSDAFTCALKRPARQDPPGIYFSKINCFTTHRPEHYDYNVGAVVKDDKENETISTAPSDEDDYYPRWRGRYEDGGGIHRLEYAPESSSRFRAYSS